MTDDTLQLEVSGIEAMVLTGIYSEETHLPQPLRVSVTVDLDLPAMKFAPDTPLDASKNYLDLKRAVHRVAARGAALHADRGRRRACLRAAVRRGRAGASGRGQDRQAGDQPGRRIDRDPLRAEPRVRPLALVTGGCRRLGAVICVALAEAGYDIALHSSPGSAPEPGLGDRLVAAGAAWRHVTADLADAEAVATLLPAVVAACGRGPSVLVNNAARFAQDLPENRDAGGAARPLCGQHRGPGPARAGDRGDRQRRSSGGGGQYPRPAYRPRPMPTSSATRCRNSRWPRQR